MSNTRARVTDVHTEHCCARHGCKYSYRDDRECTVADRGVYQSGPCEYCCEEIAEFYDVAIFINEVYENGRKIGREEAQVGCI